MKKLITELTQEQEELVPKYTEEFLNIGLSTERGDPDKAKEAIFSLYEVLGQKRPKYFFWFDNPLSTIVASQVMGKMHEHKNQLGDQLEGQLNSQLRDQLWGQLWGQLGDQLGDQLEGQLWGQLWGQLRDQLCGQLSSQLEDFNVWKCSYGQFNAYWLSFYCFINEVLPVTKSEGTDHARTILENTGFYICYEDYVFASDKPTKMEFNDQKQLHCEDGPALDYNNNYPVYALDGVRVTKDIIDLIKTKNEAEKVLVLPNVEQRLVAVKYFGVENMLPQLKAVTLDTKGGNEYELLEVTIEGQREKLLSMQNPSEPKRHYEFVPPEVHTVAEAMAWRIGWDSYKEPKAKA